MSAQARLDAIDRSLCTIEFSTDRIILDANENMLSALGYARGELIGQPHRLLVAEADRGTADYEGFWRALAAGEFRQGQFRRVDGGGRTVWLQASYNPVLDDTGRVVRIVKYATDITAARTLSAYHAAQLEALHRSQAVIEFAPDGTVLAANTAFLNIFGYAEADVVGQHHSRLVPPGHADSPEYQAFWRTLRSGAFVTGECERVGSDGRTVWLQASYNPVREADGRVAKIVKLASDITAAKALSLDHAAQMTAINRSQAVVEFTTDGTILSANDLFLQAVGYARDELVGRPHAMLVSPEEAKSVEYQQFWRKLAAGAFLSAEFRRVAKGGRSIWIQGSYNPVFDADGRVVKVVKFATDVTDIVAQRVQFQQLSLVADNTDNSVIITDAERRIQYVNNGFERLTGYKAEEVFGKHPGELLQGALTDRETVARISRHLREAKPFYDEILNYSKSGERYWVSLAINPVTNASGALEGFISIQANITETKRAALAQEVKLEAIGRLNAIVEWSSDGELLSANPALAAWGGAVRGPSVQLPRLLDAHEMAALRAGQTVRRDLAWPGADGGRLHLEAQFSPVPSLDGGPGQVVMYALDVSERRLAQAQAVNAMQENADQIGTFVTDIRAITS